MRVGRLTCTTLAIALFGVFTFRKRAAELYSPSDSDSGMAFDSCSVCLARARNSRACAWLRARKAQHKRRERGSSPTRLHTQKPHTNTHKVYIGLVASGGLLWPCPRGS
jgi:hypothetical protein